MFILIKCTFLGGGVLFDFESYVLPGLPGMSDIGFYWPVAI